MEYTDSLSPDCSNSGALAMKLLKARFKPLILTHQGRVTHICISKLTTIASDNGLSPGQRQAIIWTSAGILLIGPLGTNFSKIWSEFHTFSFRKINLKMPAKCQTFCLSLNVLTHWNPSKISHHLWCQPYLHSQPSVSSPTPECEQPAFWQPVAGEQGLHSARWSVNREQNTVGGQYQCWPGPRKTRITRTPTFWDPPHPHPIIFRLTYIHVPALEGVIT